MNTQHCLVMKRLEMLAGVCTAPTFDAQSYQYIPTTIHTPDMNSTAFWVYLYMMDLFFSQHFFFIF